MYPSLNQSENEFIFHPLPTTIGHQYSDTQHTSTEDLLVNEFSGIDFNTEPTGYEPRRSAILKEELPRIEATGEKHSEVFNEGKELSEFEDRVQSPIEAADCLTSQWMEYAKEQQSIWKYSKDNKAIEQVILYHGYVW